MASEPAKKLYLTARATVTIEYDHPSAWQQECAADQLFDQASRESMNAFERLIRSAEADGRFRVVGKPEVTMVIGVKK